MQASAPHTYKIVTIAAAYAIIFMHPVYVCTCFRACMLKKQCAHERTHTRIYKDIWLEYSVHGKFETMHFKTKLITRYNNQVTGFGGGDKGNCMTEIHKMEHTQFIHLVKNIHTHTLTTRHCKNYVRLLFCLLCCRCFVKL